MAEPDPSRPGAFSAATGIPTRGPSVPPSPRPSVTSRTSRSSLRRDRDWEQQQQQQQLDHDHHDDGPGAPSSIAPPPSPPFSPLFAIVASNAHPGVPRRNNTHYPSMHYVFADDDPDILTAALAHHHRNGVDYAGGGGGSGGVGVGAAAGSYYAEDEARGLGPEASGGLSAGAALGLGAVGGDANERAVILDLAPSADAGSGLRVAWASSLSPDWAVVSADLSRMEDTAGRSSSPPGALMLRIGGVSVDAGALPPARMPLSEGDLPSAGTRQQQQQQPPGAAPLHHDQQQQQYATDAGYAGLIRDFEKRMGVLRRVVESGEERERALAVEDEAGEAAAVGTDGGVGAPVSIAPAPGETAE